MADKIGRFELLGEIARTQWGCIYKASDPDSGQTVALKVLDLALLGDRAAEMAQGILQEAEATKPLSSHNLATLYGAGEIDGQFCASMEYVQGKSIAAMLAKKEGFSVWDLQDIARQTCQGLDHAHARKVVHYSLEPGKVLVSWDGTVKILGFGISIMGAWAAQASGTAPEVMHYMSPEQLRGEPLDGRSNIFSLGAILYEMVTGRKAFAAEDADQLRQEILMAMPVAPVQILPKVNLALSELIMKALSKLPEERYQSGQELVQDVEKCNESVPKAPVATAAPRASRVAAASPAKPSPKEPAPPGNFQGKKMAAAAGYAGTSTREAESVLPAESNFASPQVSHSNVASNGSAKMSAVSPAELENAPAPSAVPAAGENGNGSGGKHARSFSEIEELPPLAETYVPNPPPAAEVPEVVEPQPAPAPTATIFQDAPAASQEKPKTPPKEIAKKAVEAVAKTPGQLFLYALGAAAIVILLVVGLIGYHSYEERSEEIGTPQATSPGAASNQTQASAQQAPATQLPPAVEVASPADSQQAEEDQRAAVSVAPKYSRRRAARVAPAPVVIPGQLTVNSTPGGAQVLVDGHHDPSWVTPYDLTGLAPGQHLVSISKLGYAPETRTIQVASGSKSFLVVQLAALGATVSVTSAPPGAQIFMDGKDTGHATPAQIQVDHLGNHTFLVRKQGFLDETVTYNLQAGQSLQFGPTLRALGNTDDIRMVGRFKKLFGGGDTSGMGIVSIKTQPKGAQIAVNRRILDKTSPADFYLNPGSYMIDITASGYKNVHRVVNVDRGGKISIDETLDPQ